MDILVPEEFLPLWEHNEQRPIVKYPAAVLRAKAKPVDRITKSTRDLVDRMREVMKSANGIGLAAPQLGTSLRIIVVSEGKRAIALINPVVVSSEGTVVAEEGCLSLPGLYGDVTRKAIVDVEALDSEGKRVRLRLEGLPARCVQHEIDHLDGVLFIDRADLPTLHWAWPATADTD
ncbi:MAG: peptide deformylase [Armatimonadota bacterium]|nr:peptide deformylase [Armatimonadota bacterium]